MSIPRKVRDVVVARDGGCCIRCGRWADGGSLHHRMLRSQGGRDVPANLVLLCGTGTTRCHGWAHAHPEEARREGLIVWSWEAPGVVPVDAFTAGRVWLTANGSYRRAAA